MTAQVFADLWGDNRLLSSFDSINVTPPASADAPSQLPGGSWLHTDQRPSRKGVACIQGLVNLVDVGPEAGTGAPCCACGRASAAKHGLQHLSQVFQELSSLVIANAFGK